ncbi:hypothetical protein OQ968_14555 [Mycobacterium sp. 663a-19]|uniref:hypothetical protein n=1 Tax=Mycobacterium sp. 663a-19 TaxID=2986148 RepID=UPI002D1E8CE0|nr:hypothetical protein [Mycobacterium sp. 663a-19]MEB3982483.1 hypothetical protein [Mycobacterium sp. 663a-19]
MSVQDDKGADQEGGQRVTEKPEPDEKDKKQAADMMTAYEDRPTLVLPGTGGTVSGTAVNDWLDDAGNPKADAEAGGGQTGSDDTKQEQIDKDKAWNEELKEAAREENKGEKGSANR